MTDDEDFPMPEREARLAYVKAALDAAEEAGPTVVAIACAAPTCAKTRTYKRRLGEVRRSSAGLVFDARLSVDGPEDWEREMVKQLRGDRGPRLPSRAAESRCVVLLEVHRPERSDDPVVECPTCGRTPVGVDELVEAARRWRGNKPEWVMIHARSRLG